MKILLVITKGEIGGAQIFVLNLAAGLIAAGHDVSVAYGEGNYLKQELEKIAVPVINFQYLRRTNNPFANFLFIKEIYNFLKNKKFDVVHFNSSNALFGAIGAKLANPLGKNVFTVHGLSLLDPNHQSAKIKKLIYFYFFKFFFNFIDDIVFVGQNNYDWALKNKLIKNGTVIYNGLDKNELAFLYHEEARVVIAAKTNPEIKNCFLIGSIGRLAYPKNYEFLINLMPQILQIEPSAKLIIIGTGPEKKKYSDLIVKNKLENNVYLLGEISNAPKLIKAFDLFVLPSVYEGVSITLTEAMLADVKIMASRVGGTPEIIKDDNSLFTLNDEQDFLQKFKQIKNSRVIPADENFKNKFERATMVAKYLATYQN